MKSLSKDHLVLFAVLLAVLFVLGISTSLKVSLLTSAALLLIGATVLYGLFVLAQPLLVGCQDAPSGIQLHLGEVLGGPWGRRPTPFKLILNRVRHILVTGVTGAGKSTLIRRMIEELRQNDLSFLYIDFKGEREDHNEIVQICKATGDGSIPQVFDLSDPENCLTCNLLTILSSIEETVGFIVDLFFDKDANPYYKAEAERFLRHSLELLDATTSPRSFQSLEEILTNPRERDNLISSALDRGCKKKSFVRYFENEFKDLSSRDRSERFSGFSSLLSSFTSDPLARIFNAPTNELALEQIFSEDQSVLIRIPGEAYGDLSKRIVRAFIKALPILIAKRRSQLGRKDYFILMDEGCSYASEVMADLSKKAGSAQVKLLVTRMADADFLDVHPAFQGQMLSSFGTHFCFHTTDPDTRETLARLSTTIDDTKQTYRMKEGSQTGEASEREVQKFRVHPSEFARLKTGECIVMDTRQDLFQKIRVLPAETRQEKKSA